jgi:gamma-glutamylcyclotransferase (GGCT)/AIG2-like uncharacterized protein YtfP
VSTRLFVYGTLAPGRPNEHVLKGVPGTWESATVRGDLRQRGWGAAMGFPVIVLREDAPEVRGFLFSSDVLPEYWRRLDDFEGRGYERVLTQVERQGGERVDAYVYVARERVQEDLG